MKKLITAVLCAAAGFAALPAAAQSLTTQQQATIKQLLSTYADKAKADAAKNKTTAEPFSADSGRQLFMKARNWEGNEEPACAGCHTEDPAKDGRHASSKKPIRPLAPAANVDRFTDAAKVEKNFATHCREIYSRDCSSQEKGHILTFLAGLK